MTPTAAVKTPRERNVGLTNRVVGGMLLHQTRANETNCSDSKFNRIQQTCTGPRTVKAFGVSVLDCQWGGVRGNLRVLRGFRHRIDSKFNCIQQPCT